MVKGHVCFYLFRVRAGGWFPAGFFCGSVEVVGEIFGVGVPNFPLGGKTGIGGGHIDCCESVVRLEEAKVVSRKRSRYV